MTAVIHARQITPLSVRREYPRCNLLGPLDVDIINGRLYVVNRCSFSIQHCNINGSDWSTILRSTSSIDQLKTFRMTHIGSSIYWATSNRFYMLETNNRTKREILRLNNSLTVRALTIVDPSLQPGITYVLLCTPPFILLMQCDPVLVLAWETSSVYWRAGHVIVTRTPQENTVAAAFQINVSTPTPLPPPPQLPVFTAMGSPNTSFLFLPLNSYNTPKYSNHSFHHTQCHSSCFLLTPCHSLRPSRIASL